MTIGARRDQRQRQTAGIGHGGAFQPLLPAIHGRTACFLPAAGRFGDTAVDHDVVEVDPDQAVILVKRQPVQRRCQPRLRLGLHPPPDGSIGTSRGGNPFISGPVDQRGHHVLEDHPIRDPRPMTPERMGRCDHGTGRHQRRELFPHGVHERYWEHRHGTLHHSPR